MHQAKLLKHIRLKMVGSEGYSTNLFSLKASHLLSIQDYKLLHKTCGFVLCSFQSSKYLVIQLKFDVFLVPSNRGVLFKALFEIVW